MRHILLLLTSVLLLAACGRNAPSAPSEPTATPVAAEPAPYPGPVQEPYPVPDLGALPPEVAQLLSDRLARHLNVPLDQIRFVSAETREWSDSSLGCPDPAATYQAIIVPGYLVNLTDGSKSYALHLGLGAQPGQPIILCQNGMPTDLTEAIPIPPLGADGQKMVELARADLAKQLAIDPQSITLITANATEWNDSSLGCPKPGLAYLQVITSGYLIQLEANGTIYNYHTDDQQQVINCTP